MFSIYTRSKRNKTSLSVTNEFNRVDRTSRHKNSDFSRFSRFSLTYNWLPDFLRLFQVFQSPVNPDLSPLRSHKKHQNFADTPTDICPYNQGIEDSRHFVFECFTFATQRARLAVAVTDVLHRNNLIDLANKEELYLYGHPSLSSVNNRRILSTTIQYTNNYLFHFITFPKWLWLIIFCHPIRVICSGKDLFFCKTKYHIKCSVNVFQWQNNLMKLSHDDCCKKHNKKQVKHGMNYAVKSIWSGSRTCQSHLCSLYISCCLYTKCSRWSLFIFSFFILFDWLFLILGLTVYNCNIVMLW